jgi:aspartokinase-like uncharacterized kinase
VKVGGGLLARTGALDLVTEALSAVTRGRRVLIVPGGGPFAEAVRTLYRRVKIGEDAGHWMAVLGMDQYAHALADRIAGAELVEQEADIREALTAGRLPVLAPYRWFRSADPLPHSWDVTSDSIAAWFAGALGARRVVLIKPVPGDVTKLVDSYFLRTLPVAVEHLIVTPDDLGQLDSALWEGGAKGRGRRTHPG